MVFAFHAEPQPNLGEAKVRKVSAGQSQSLHKDFRRLLIKSGRPCHFCSKASEKSVKGRCVFSKVRTMPENLSVYSRNGNKTNGMAHICYLVGM
ncbi:MAG: hypothetical protein II338_05650, partial [Bacteroidaceae bacterium]|nr:hypothetical protein [Bacteroidaceae bacterium]